MQDGPRDMPLRFGVPHAIEPLEFVMNQKAAVSRTARALTTLVCAATTLCAAAFTASPAAAELAQPASSESEGSVLFNCATYPSNRSTTRSEALTRAQSWIDARVPYSQSACHNNQYGNYRTDCSGFVSMAWGLRMSFTTSDIHLVSHTIPRSELQPGDALNNPGSHVALFLRWADAARTRPIVREQAGPNGSPTVEREWSATTAAAYTPIRYDNIVDDVAGIPSDRVNQLNADGYSDLVAVDADGKIFGYHNGSLVNPGGQPYYQETWRAQDSDWSSALHMATGDINNDGYADLVAARADGSLVIYNNGSLVHPGGVPFLSQTWLYQGNWHTVRQLAVADVTGDRWADLIAVEADGSMAIYGNNALTNPGGTPFTTVTWRAGNWSAVRHLVLSDVNRDGYADLVGIDGNGQVFGYHNGRLVNPGGVPFASETWRLAGSNWSGALHLTAGDVNRDGWGDVTGIEADGSMSIYLNNILVNPGGVPYLARTWHLAGAWQNIRTLG